MGGGGGGGGGSRGIFPVRFINVTFQIIELLQISLLICDISPFSNQVLRRFFSMDNLRGYSEDDTSSSACLGPSCKELPSPSVGTAPPLGTQDAVVAGTLSSYVPVPSGPVPPVSAQPGPSLPGSRDCVTPSSGNKDDLLPPPPPVEPYEDFLARVGHDQSDSARPATQPTAVARPSASVTTTTTGTRLPTPFPTFEDSSWMLPNQVPASRIRMPLPASFYAASPSPWVWPGRGPAVTAPAVKALQPAPPPAALAGLPGSSGRFPGPFPGGPAPIPPTVPALPDSEICSPTPPRFHGDFSGATPPFVQPLGNPVPQSDPGLASVAPTVTQPDTVNPSQGLSPAMIKSWKEDFMREIKSSWAQFLGDAPPQPTVGPSVPVANMGPNALRQLSPSDDREAFRAQHKAGSKRADSGVRQSSRSSERSSTDRHRDRVRHRRVSPDSSSPTRHLSPPAKRSRLGGHHAPCGFSSSAGGERSLRARLPRRSRSPLPRHRGPSPSSSSHHRSSRDSSAPSRWPFEAGKTRRLAGQSSLSPRRRSPASQRRSRRSSWGRHSSPPLRTRAPNRHSSLSSSRSPSPRGRRSCSVSSRRQRSWSSSRNRISRPHAADQHLLRLRIDDGDQHPRDSPIPEQSITVDDSQLSAEKVQKLFGDLLDPPALSHYDDPLPDSTLSNQLVPYDPTAVSSSAAWSGINVELLETHGLFQNYQSFHRLSGDQDKEACTAAYHDLTNLMLSQTPEEVSLINVSSSRPKPEGPYSSFLAATDELKKSRTKSIFNGLHFRLITKLSSVP